MAAFRLDYSITAGELDTLDIAGRVAAKRLTPQNEAVALVQAWEHDGPDPCEELAALRCIAINSLAVGMVAARGIDIAKRIATLENITASFSRERHIDAEDTDPDAPPRGADWCRNGCQPLYGMECGMCGYDGHGVWADEAGTGMDAERRTCGQTSLNTIEDTNDNDASIDGDGCEQPIGSRAWREFNV